MTALGVIVNEVSPGQDAGQGRGDDTGQGRAGEMHRAGGQSRGGKMRALQGR